MFAISADFRAALYGSHQIATRVEVLRDGVVLETLDVAVAGQVSVDKNAPVRRTCQVRLVDRDGTLTPTSAGDLLTPFGTELRLWRGVTFGDSTTEMVPLITARISRVEIDDSPNGVILTVSGHDRSRSIARNRWTSPYTVTSGTETSAAIQELISDRGGALTPTFNFLTTTYNTPQLVFLDGDDPWKRAVEMAQAAGYDLYFDQMGDCVLEPEPDPLSAPIVWTYLEGSTATFFGIRRDLNDEGTYNGVVMTGEGSQVDTPVRAEVWDENPSSPTYRYGSYGQVPYFESSPMITTEAQATDAATAKLRRTVGLAEQVSFPAVVNPAHEPGDLVAITRETAGIEDLYLLDSFNVPLEASASMQATCREYRVFTA